MTPNEWEDLIDSCYSIRFPGKWHKVPAAYKGDCGIEGFTDDGIVYQCYYPEQVYSNDELYEHQRNKLTDDIAKIFKESNIQNLVSTLGRVKIKEWHLVVPEYKDRRILAHANKKEAEYLEVLKNTPSQYSYIDNSLRITVMQANSFIVEISRTILSRNNKIKLRLDSSNEIDYSQCDVDKVKNIKRKVKAIQPNLSDDSFNKIVNIYINSYLEGIALINKLRVELPNIFKELHDLLSAYKSDVELKTAMNANSSMNKEIFDGIMAEFLNELTQLNIFDRSTIYNLKNDIIAGWLADCSMEFVA